MECADNAPTRKDAKNCGTNYAELQIVALQEIRWKGQGQIKKDKYNLYYSCNKSQTGQLGTGFLVKKEIVTNILGFEPINERISKLRLKGKFHNITIINTHAPTEEKDEETKNASM